MAWFYGVDKTAVVFKKDAVLILPFRKPVMREQCGCDVTVFEIFAVEMEIVCHLPYLVLRGADKSLATAAVAALHTLELPGR